MPQNESHIWNSSTYQFRYETHSRVGNNYMQTSIKVKPIRNCFAQKLSMTVISQLSVLLTIIPSDIGIASSMHATCTNPALSAMLLTVMCTVRWEFSHENFCICLIFKINSLLKFCNLSFFT